MALTKKIKKKIIKKFARKKDDTGSPEIQVALLTTRIKDLVGHLQDNTKDNSSRKGLLAIIAKRRRLLNYLRRESKQRYQKLIKELNLKK